MADLHQVIQLRAPAYSTFASGCTIDRRPGAHLDVIFQYDATSLWNLQPVSLFVFRVTKSVTTNHRVVVDHNSLINLGSFTYRDARVDQAIFADRDIVVDAHVRKRADPIGDMNSLTNDNTSPDLDMFCNHC